ncbi:VOC family protein [Lacrimispora sp. NSJ-141]|uniref:VOC family protein n=1 Tax=Lientehia hominis TaxID=2897778 RepID=A0AAP2RIY6_9FIRM|nr:VOC family protein [Lientehia hominis]MCD2492606.1 VOC family protein [Lientehia hominis]
MRIDHMAVYVKDLEKMKEFYQKYFGGVSGERYHNEKTGLMTYFLSWDGESRLELMTRPGLKGKDTEPLICGYAHLAFCVESRKQVDVRTAELAEAGYHIVSGPRVTGDGYYESCVLDPEGNQIEIVG